MRQAGGMATTSHLVDAYVAAEAANFDLFNQVASVNAQIAQLQQLTVQQQLLVERLRYGLPAQNVTKLPFPMLPVIKQVTTESDSSSMLVILVPVLPYKPKHGSAVFSKQL